MCFSFNQVPFILLQGALRNAIATFIHVSPVLKDTIWSYLEQYDLPVVVGSHVGKVAQPMTTQVSCVVSNTIVYRFYTVTDPGFRFSGGTLNNSTREEKKKTKYTKI